jgi:phosphoribosyl-AMP cyclohydrolase
MQNISPISIQEFFNQIKFDQNGLVPAIAQSSETGEVLMLAYMNRQSIQKTLESKLACYWSRSRQSFWTKGETSGYLQHIEEVLLDCDGDTILLKVKQIGPACHTGADNCFFRKVAI